MKDLKKKIENLKVWQFAIEEGQHSPEWFDEILKLVEKAEQAGYRKGAHDQRHREIGVTRWAYVGDEHGYWKHPFTQRKMKSELREEK